MAHDHSSHIPPQAVTSLNKAFIIGISLNLMFVFAEFAAGLYFNSLALISDAGHNLTDVVSLVLALFAFRLAKLKPTLKYTYGYKKSTVLVSLLNAMILLVVVGGIIMQSIHKIQNPQEVSGNAIALVAGIGVVINGITAFLFVSHKGKDLNVKGAYLHMVADALISLGVLAAGIIIAKTGWYIIDPVIGIILAVVILFFTWNLLHDSLRLSLDGVPVSIDTEKVKEAISSVWGVKSMHHVHIWAISTTENALTAHIVLDDAARMQDVKQAVKRRLEDFNISHATLEFEIGDVECHGDSCK